MGLVTYDRKVRKDAYYWYRANWTTAPMAYITSRRAVVRDTPAVTVKVYANVPSVSLRLNGRDLGSAPVVDHANYSHLLAEDLRGEARLVKLNAIDSQNHSY